MSKFDLADLSLYRGREYRSGAASHGPSQYKAWLERITYRPNVIIHVDHDIYSNQIVLRIVVKTIDSRDMKTPIDIHHNRTIEAMCIRNFDDFKHLVKEALFTVEKHEFDEFFRVDGVMLNDPHKGDR